MTPSRFSVGLSVPSLTLSPASSSLAVIVSECPPVNEAEAVLKAEVDIQAVEDGVEEEAEAEVQLLAADSADESSDSEHGGGWQTVNPGACATQFDFHASLFADEDDDSLADEPLPPPVNPSLSSSDPPHLQAQFQNVGTAELPSQVKEAAVASASLFPSLPSNLPSGPLPPPSSPPADTPSPINAAVPSPVVPSSQPQPPDVPCVPESPSPQPPIPAAASSTQRSAASPSLASPAPPLLPLPSSAAASSPLAAQLASSQGSHAVLSLPSSPPDPELMSQTSYGPASLHPSLPALEPGTLDEEEHQRLVDEEEDRLKTLHAMEVVLDDSGSVERTTDSLLLRRGGTTAVTRDSQVVISSPSMLGKRKAGATSSLTSSPPTASPPPVTGTPTRSRVLPLSGSPVTASQLLTDSQVSQLEESQTFDGSLYQATLSSLHPLPTPSSLFDEAQHASARLSESHAQALGGEVDDEEIPQSLPSQQSSEDEVVEVKAEVQVDVEVEDVVDSRAAYQDVMEVELDFDDGEEVGGPLRSPSPRRSQTAASASPVKRETDDSQDAAFDLRSAMLPSPSRPLMLSPTFTTSPASPDMSSPLQPTWLSPPRRRRMEEQGKEPVPPPRTRSLVHTPAVSSSGKQGAAGKANTLRTKSDEMSTRPLKSGRNELLEVRRSSPRKQQQKDAPPSAARKSAVSHQRRVERSADEEGEEEEEEEADEEDSVGVQSIDEDDDFVPVTRSTAVAKSVAAPNLRSATTTSPKSVPPKLTAKGRIQQRPPQPKPSPALLALSGAKRRSREEEAEEEESIEEVEEPVKKRSKANGASQPRGAGQEPNSATRPSPTEGQRPAGRSKALKPLRQTSLNDFSFSNSTSLPSEDELFVRPAPAPRRSAARQPLGDVTNTASSAVAAGSLSPPAKGGRQRKGEKTPWQLKRKKTGGLATVNDEPLYNTPSPARPKRLPTPAPSSSSSRGSGGRRKASAALRSHATGGVVDPFRYEDEVNLVDSQ